MTNIQHLEERDRRDTNSTKPCTAGIVGASGNGLFVDWDCQLNEALHMGFILKTWGKGSKMSRTV